MRGLPAHGTGGIRTDPSSSIGRRGPGHTGLFERKAMSDERSRLYITPCTHKQACEFIELHHRHHRPPLRAIVKVAVMDERGRVRGVAMAGRPVARMADDGSTLEVNRVATDGCPNACSALYGAVARVTGELGYRDLITYTLPSEGGASLRGAGWVMEGPVGGGKWERDRRKRNDDWPSCGKWRWRRELSTLKIQPAWPKMGEDIRQLSLLGQIEEK